MLTIRQIMEWDVDISTLDISRVSNSSSIVNWNVMES